MERTELQIIRGNRTQERLRNVARQADFIGVSSEQIMLRWFNTTDLKYINGRADCNHPSGKRHLRSIHLSLIRNGIHSIEQDRGKTDYILYIDTKNLSEETINYLTVELDDEDAYPDVYFSRASYPREIKFS